MLASFPGSTAKSLRDLSQVVLFSVLVSFLPSLPSGGCTSFPKICFWCVSVCIESYISCIYLVATTLQLLPDNCRLLTLWYRTLERECFPWPRRHCVLLRWEEGKGWVEVWGITPHWTKLHPFLPLHSLFIFWKCASFGKEMLILTEKLFQTVSNAVRFPLNMAINLDAWMEPNVETLSPLWVLSTSDSSDSNYQCWLSSENHYFRAC